MDSLIFFSEFEVACLFHYVVSNEPSLSAILTSVKTLTREIKIDAFGRPALSFVFKVTMHPPQQQQETHE